MYFALVYILHYVPWILQLNNQAGYLIIDPEEFPDIVRSLQTGALQYLFIPVKMPDGRIYKKVRTNQQPCNRPTGNKPYESYSEKRCKSCYIADARVAEEMKQCRRILQKLNFLDRSDSEAIAEVVHSLINCEGDAWINPPFYCDYGKHIHVGRNFFANYNCTIIDVAEVTIGMNCQMAPNVSIYTAGHPVHPDTRNTAFEYGMPVTIGDNVWIGGSTVILPGVHIGSNTVIGAGSVVTHDIPDWVVAAGNPCRVLRPVTDADRRTDFRHRQIDDEAWRQICAMNHWDPDT